VTWSLHQYLKPVRSRLCEEFGSTDTYYYLHHLTFRKEQKMWVRIKKLLSPPTFEDEEKNRIANLLNMILLAFIGLLIVTEPGMYLSDPGNLPQQGGLLVSFCIMILSYGLLRFGYVNIASYIFVGGLWGLLSIVTLMFGGIRAPAYLVFMFPLISSGLLLGKRGVIIFTGLILASGVAAVVVEVNGLLAVSFEEFEPPPTAALASHSFTLLMSGVLLYVTISSLNNVLKRVKDKEGALRESNQELETIKTTLEERVMARTERLEIIAALSERLNAILDVEQLLPELVNQVKERFQYYHVHIYLLDEARQNLIMRAGVGRAGMQGHQIPLDTAVSLVARSARSGEVVFVNDVRQSPDWLPNPSLPDTRAEMAVPIMQQGQVVGVLDVQEDKVGGLDESDANLLRSLANQVAVALSNARLFEETTQAKEAAELAQEDTEIANTALEAQVWQTTGQAELNDKMQGEQDVPTLANSVIQQLCQYLDAQIGALYITENQSLNLIGTYAYRNQNPINHFKFGESLVGQAAVEKEPKIIVDVPDDYITIGSGFGQTRPRHIMVFPVMYEERVVGVIEMGTLAEFNQAQLEFLQTALDSIAIAFNTAQARARIDELLVETQQQAEELQVQGEELKVANEELEAQTQSLRASEAKLTE
jgi:GAF domain-containing protein